MRNRPPSPRYCLFLPVAFLFSKKKKRVHSPKNRFGACVPMGFETFFFSSPSSHASSLARPRRKGRGKNTTHTRQEKQSEGGRGGRESLWSVWRKDCGKLRMEHPWSLALYAEGTRSRNFRASCRYEGFMGNPSMSTERPLSGLASFPLDGRLGFSREVSDPHQAACRHSSSHPQCKDSHSLYPQATSFTAIHSTLPTDLCSCYSSLHPSSYTLSSR